MIVESRYIRDYLKIIGENHGDVILIDVTLLLHGELILRSPTGDGVQIRKRVKENSGFRIQEADAALAVGPTRAQRLEFVGRFWDKRMK